MDTAYQRKWYASKVEIADGIVDRHGRNGEQDAEILLCCAISALAAKMWPGRGIDQYRFIELLVRFAPVTMGIQKISIPLLAATLREKDEVAFTKLINIFFHPKHEYDGKLSLDEHSLPVSLLLRILRGNEIDQSEESVITVLENFPTKELRKHSYGAIIYQDLRSGLIHEYALSSRLAAVGMSVDDEIPSYANFSILPDENLVREVSAQYNVSMEEARASLAENRRRLHFPYKFIRNLAVETAEAIFQYWDSAMSLESPQPTIWWINS